MVNKKITIGIPAFKANGYVDRCLESINKQTIRDLLHVIIAPDNPSDDYTGVLSRYPELDIEIIPCQVNLGAGLTRQKILEHTNTDWIIFMDVDDIFTSSTALESLYSSAI